MFNADLVLKKFRGDVPELPVPDALDLRSQLGPLLSFAAGARVPNGFGYLDAGGKVDPEKPAELWITCRMTHVFSLAAMLGVEGAADLAAHGVRSLQTAFHDPVCGGWFSAVETGIGKSHVSHVRVEDDTKAAYAHAFVVLAASSALAAGVSGAHDLLTDALRVQAEHWYEPDFGLVRESWDRCFRQSEDYRGINANMHTVEAYLAAADLTGDRDLLDKAIQILLFVVSQAREYSWRIPEHYTADWQVLPEYNSDDRAHAFRPYGVTPGHGLEWARLMLQARQSLVALGERPPEWMLPSAVELYRRAVDDSWAIDGQPGFIYTSDFEGVPVVTQRMHWVLTEAVGANLVLQRVLGDEVFPQSAELLTELGDQLTQWGDFAGRFLVEEPGQWYHELDEQNRPDSGTWPGKPDAYHVMQMLLLPHLPASPAFAAALAKPRQQ